MLYDHMPVRAASRLCNHIKTIDFTYTEVEHKLKDIIPWCYNVVMACHLEA